MSKRKVEWKNVMKDGLPTKEAWYWVKRIGRDGIEFALASPESNLNFLKVTHWAEIEYPEPPEEEKMSRLEEHLDPLFYTSKEINLGKHIARLLIQALEHSPKQEPLSGAYFSFEDRVNYLRDWCGLPVVRKERKVKNTPDRERSEVSALEMWCEQHCTPEGYILTSVAQQVARKLIEVMEQRGYDHPHRAAGIDYNQGYIDGRQETINYIKRWCEEE